ncbi:hypothetical protein JYU34_013961 [Plutella xylostella]|uniref:Uncharacterized protein n=1 Tax=Plutella xylostella TaxID=51655 RepID=A0ABQ7QB17_PLUXY|nr:hypothetical protein JYU34_013961 [Plutella xylostella]
MLAPRNVQQKRLKPGVFTLCSDVTASFTPLGLSEVGSCNNPRNSGVFFLMKTTFPNTTFENTYKKLPFHEHLPLLYTEPLLRFLLSSAYLHYMSKVLL